MQTQVHMYRHGAIVLPTRCRDSRVDHAGDRETPAVEPAVARECLTEIAGTHDQDGAAVGAGKAAGGKQAVARGFPFGHQYSVNQDQWHACFIIKQGKDRMNTG